MDKGERRALLVSVHADDVEIGCGGTVARMLEDGWKVLWIVFAASKKYNPKEGFSLKSEFLEVVRCLGLSKKNYRIYDLPFRKMFRKRRFILQKFVDINRSFRPNMIMVPAHNDCHEDHETVVWEAIRAFKWRATILGYEIPMNYVMPFRKNMLVRLEKRHIEKKLEMVGKYESQFKFGRKFFSVDIISGLAKIHGVECDTDYAEAFELIRGIV